MSSEEKIITFGFFPSNMTSRSARTSSCIVFVSIFLVTALFTAALSFGQPNFFDEGFIVSGAMMVRRGWLPIRDLFVIYGPAQYYLLAALFGTFGEDLFVGRVASIVAMSLVVTSVGLCARLTSNTRFVWPILTAVAALSMTLITMPSPGYAAVSATIFLAWSVLGHARWFASGSVKWLATTSLLLGTVGLFRWDFGLFGIFAHFVTLCISLKVGPVRTGSTTAAVGYLVGPWLTVMLFCFGTFVFLGDARQWFEEVPKFAVFEFQKWRSVEFIRPHTESLLNASRTQNLWLMAKEANSLMVGMTPFLLGLMAFCMAARRLLYQRTLTTSTDVSTLLVSLITLALLNQMRVRPTLVQGYPAYMMSLPLAAYVLSFYEGSGRLRVAKVSARLVAGAVLLLLPAYGAKNALYNAFFMNGQSERSLSKASFIHWSANSIRLARDYEDLLKYVRSSTAEGEPILSGVVDMSRLFVNDAMLYFLADRPSAARWVEMEPGLTNTAKGQMELIDAIRSKRVNIIVLHSWLSTEPNATSRSNGVHLLDDFLSENFVEQRRFGDAVVLTRSTLLP